MEEMKTVVSTDGSLGQSNPAAARMTEWWMTVCLTTTMEWSTTV